LILQTLMRVKHLTNKELQAHMKTPLSINLDEQSMAFILRHLTATRMVSWRCSSMVLSCTHSNHSGTMRSKLSSSSSSSSKTRMHRQQLPQRRQRRSVQALRRCGRAFLVRGIRMMASLCDWWHGSRTCSHMPETGTRSSPVSVVWPTHRCHTVAPGGLELYLPLAAGTFGSAIFVRCEQRPMETLTVLPLSVAILVL